MHQPGVSRHLKVLRDAGLVEVRRDAQRRIYRLRPDPLKELDAWLEPYRAEWAGRLDALEAHLERTATPITNPGEGAAMSSSPHGTIERTPDGGVVRFDRSLAFSIEDVWAAITEPERLADWWPPFAADITVDLREGGRIVFAWPETDFPTLEFMIVRLDAPTLFEHTHTSPGSWTRWELEATTDGTHLRATYFVPDLDMALERGDLVGLHYSLDRLTPALAGSPVAWNNDSFGDLVAAYAQLSSGSPGH